MSIQFVPSEYIEQALAQAEYDKLEDGSFSGRIAACPGVIAFSATLRECEVELSSTLEEWLWLGLKLGQQLPMSGIIQS
jgi:predicted RNase H-like HicB family nuclease